MYSQYSIRNHSWFNPILLRSVQQQLLRPLRFLFVSSLLWAGGAGRSKHSLEPVVRISLSHRKHLSLRGDQGYLSTKVNTKYRCHAARFQRRAEGGVKGYILKEQVLELAQRSGGLTTQGMVRGYVIPASLGSLIKMQNLRPHLGATKSESAY